MRKFIACVLVLSLVLGFALPVAAQEEPQAEPVVYEEIVIRRAPAATPAPIPQMPIRMFPEEIRSIERDGKIFISLRDWAELSNVNVEWVDELGAVLVYVESSDLGVLVSSEDSTRIFVEEGVLWVTPEVVDDMFSVLFPFRFVMPDFGFDAERIERLNPTLWDDISLIYVSAPMFTLELGYGEIAAGYIYYMSQNIPMRTAFSYTELIAAQWIVAELLAMGHSPDNIVIEEFCYWEVNDYRIGMWGGGVSWWSVLSMLGHQDQELLRRDRVSQNVVLTVPGTSDRTIIVGAHYDSPPDPGTSDNASGTALLMESAKRMLDYDNYYTIRYVFFGAEEVGLIGAAWHLHLMDEAERDNIVMMINADVLLEGPVIIYGAAAQADVSAMDRGEIIAAMEVLLQEQFAQITESPWFSWEEEMRWLGVDTIEEAMEIMQLQMEFQLTMFEIMPDRLFEQQTRNMRLGWDITPSAARVSEIATELALTHDFEFRSIPRAVAMPTDSLIFLEAGFTVVNFTGMEYRENIPEEMANQLTRLGEGFPEYGLTVTILHSDLDDYYFIESQWPGMIRNNMYAFVTMLNAILTAQLTN
ncbi:MAG: M28 family peptidase [Defluviitaleaceae bacterium]|nr:M28 family peptidase [Defluviitaleaceae bacterium]